MYMRFDYCLKKIEKENEKCCETLGRNYVSVASSYIINVALIFYSDLPFMAGSIFNSIFFKLRNINFGRKIQIDKLQNIFFLFLKFMAIIG